MCLMETFCHSEACLCNTSSEPADIYAKVDVLSNKTEPHRTLSPKWEVCRPPCCHQSVSTNPGVPTKTPGWDYQHCLTVPPSSALSQLRLCPPVLPDRPDDAPHSRASSLLSVPSHMAGTQGSHIKEEVEAVSSLHFTPASAKLTHGRDLAVTQPLFFACICCPREPGASSLV